jgi:conjugal transfer/type IV secretion protein DotA/TraY
LTSFNTILLDAGTGLAFWQGSLGIIYAAQNGSLEGSNIHAVISPVRTLLGAGALFPVVGGYCLMQLFALQVLGGGYWMANQLYSSMTTFNASAATPTTNNMAFDEMKPLIAATLEVETCLAWLNDNNADASAAGVSLEASYYGSSASSSSNLALTPPSFTSSGTNSYVANFGECGTLSIGSAENADSNATTAVQGGSAFDKSRNQQLDQFLTSIWSSQLPQSLAGIFTANGGSALGQSAAAAPTEATLASQYSSVTSAASSYLTSLEGDAKTLTSSGLTPFGTATTGAAGSLGWVSAGALYSVISQIYTRSTGAVDSSIPSLTITSLEGVAPDDISKIQSSYNEADSFMSSAVLPVEPTLTSTSGTLTPVAPTTNGTSVNGAEDVQQLLNTPSAGILFWLDNNLSIDPSDPMASVTSEGLFFLHSGEAIVGAVGGVKVVSAVAQFTGVGKTLAGAASVANTVSGGALNGAVSKLASIAVILGEVLMALGAFEAFVIPMLFYIAWLFQIVNCIAFAAEFVLAAPLAAYQFMRINGTEAIGQEQRAFFMIAFMQGFLRPSLLIFGLAISTYVFSAIAAVLNSTFNLAVAAEQGGDIVGPIKIVTFVVMLVYIQWQLCVRSISLIGRVPDAVADLIGGGLGRLSGADEAALGVVGSVGPRVRGIAAVGFKTIIGDKEKDKKKPETGKETSPRA